MTSASELFYNRRSRTSRISDPFEGGSDLPHPGGRQHRHPIGHSRRDRLGIDACEPPLRRASHQPRQPAGHRPSPHQLRENELDGLEQGVQQFSSNNNNHDGDRSNVGSMRNLSGNDRLPGAVLLARERLVQRLRGATLSSSRRSIRSSFHNNDYNAIEVGDAARLVDGGDWETDISSEWLAALTSLAGTSGRQVNKRPPGLTQIALNSLHVEFFSLPQENDRASKECSICLESFLEGDKLTCLPCGHRYHFCCIDPWVRVCGDCPYCRRSIDFIDSVKEILKR